MEDILPRAIPLCGYGFGNFWVVEVQRSGAWGPIFFANHDPPVLVVQARDMATFIDEVFSLGRPDRKSAIDEVHDAASTRIWREEPWGKQASSLVNAPDETLCTFTKTSNADDLVVDLREQIVGSGFAWGRHGPNTGVKRYGAALVFAMLALAKKSGFFKRVFGG